MEKTIEEVKFILDHRKKEKPEEEFKFLCTGLSARYLSFIIIFICIN